MSKYEKSKYEYTKQRRDFGRQTLFQSVPAKIIDSIYPVRSEQKMYILRNPVHRQVQATLPQSTHVANTQAVVLHETGINHEEGGWPKDVHLLNEDHVTRHRRRVMHEDSYVHTILNVSSQMKHYIKQNNAIDMYQTYFDKMTPQAPVEKYVPRIGNEFRDPLKRPISCIVWTNEKKTKIAASYCDRNYLSNDPIPENNDCYLWNIHNQSAPEQTLEPDQPCWQLACSPIEPDILVGGLQNGTVCVFDIRDNPKPVATSSVYNSHFGPITSLLYIHTRTNTEFFTGSPDGQCLWWDSRNLSAPTNQIPMSIDLKPNEEPNLSNAESVSSLEYDTALPTKFLCGTDSGLVLNVNRMGRSHAETVYMYWSAHSGPVRQVQRSPCTSRMFLTCGDFTVRIWSEEVRTAPIIVTKPYKCEVADVVWAPLRYSSYMVAGTDGFFYHWDFLRKYKEPVATLHVSKHALTKISPHVKGHLVAIGDVNGSIYLLELSENMWLPGNYDKQLFFQTYTRETNREHILDNRIKELRLKAKAEEAAADASIEPEVVDEEDSVEVAEMEYLKIVKEELSQMDGVSAGNLSIS